MIARAMPALARLTSRDVHTYAFTRNLRFTRLSTSS